MLGVFLDLDSLNPGDLELGSLRSCIPDWRFYAETAPAQIIARVANAQIVVTNKVPLDRKLFEQAGELQLVCVAATGTNNVDLQAAADHSVVVSNARDYATASVVEHVYALILTLYRQLDAYRTRVGAGDWSQSRHFCLFDRTIEELAGKTLGIIGYGVLGQAVARLARAFAMQVKVAQRLYGEPLPDRVSLDELLETSDIISLHCPLSDQTRNLIGKKQLRRMQRSAILINTARGGIVDEHELVRALEQNWIAGAAIDVLAKEPPATDSPLLRHLSPRLIVTPHIAWASRAARQRLVAEIRENIQAFLDGEPRNQVS